LQVSGKSRRAHRISYEEFIGPIPEGKIVCHTCDNPGCINPAHLFVGDNSDNMNDMVIKGRSLKGEKHPGNKLTALDVSQIRARYTPGAIRQEDLAQEFGVNQTTIERIINRKIWKHI